MTFADRLLLSVLQAVRVQSPLPPDVLQELHAEGLVDASTDSPTLTARGKAELDRLEQALAAEMADSGPSGP
ncbi:hypothetical protein [Rhizobacter sp. LjRoot28]|jgi:ribosomal protein S19E (S16A)|uniref:hypothetical protein n=1 Tax=Rhizobacter sp. LjRoot28 TaxID=3342309 RepID=UPI003ECC838C